MARAFLLVSAILGVTAVGAALAACDSSSSSSGGGAFGADGGSFEAGGYDGAAAPSYTVECTHPGAGAALPDGGCECPQSLVVFTGTWNGLYTCRQGLADGGTCFEQDQAEAFTFTQTNNHLTAYEGSAGSPTFLFDGVVCQDWLVWSGGPTDGTYTECGTLHFTDANHYVKDSCYLNQGASADAGTCLTSLADGCPDRTGQCTNSGARAPEQAPAITKNICP